ncbi:hypothetical protein PQX77_020925 [Marasmius sp. AFHP31]|nr:hypothetical protein PQX77_020925 [Marasmius sp. AFHP31]
MAGKWPQASIHRNIVHSVTAQSEVASSSSSRKATGNIEWEAQDVHSRSPPTCQNYGVDPNISSGSGDFNTGPQYNVGGGFVQSFTSAVSRRVFLWLAQGITRLPLYTAHKTLWDMVVGVKASHDSDSQFERGCCLNGTREAILTEIHAWRQARNREFPVCGLSGPAGVGRSEVALTIAKACERDGLATSFFFFFRSDPKRNNPSALVPTIAHGLVVTSPWYIRRRINQRIAADPRVLEASLEDQLRELVVALLEDKGWLSRLGKLWTSLKLVPLSAKRLPDLVVIDDLDDCGDSVVQRRILSVFLTIFERSPRVPLKFLIYSRPESWIREAFDSLHSPILTKRVLLDDSVINRQNVSHRLMHGFQKIRDGPKNSQVEFSDPWPAHHVVGRLADKVFDQFVYVKRSSIS